MKSPETVRASDGKKYFDPSGFPTSSHWRGSCTWRMSMPPAKTPATPAHRAPTFQLIFRPARRCRTKSQAQKSGRSTWLQ